MILKDYKHEVGKSCRTVAIRNLMERNGLVLKEDFVLGIAEGFKFSFVVPDGNLEHNCFKCMAPSLDQFENFAKNMQLEYQTITKAKNDFKDMERILLYEDIPVICEVVPEKYKKYINVDGQMWDELRMDIPLVSHITEVVGIDDSYVYIYENYSNNIFKIPKKVFKRARNVNWDSYLNPHHKIHHFIIPANLKNIDLKKVIYRAIKNNIDSYCYGTNNRLGSSAFCRFKNEYSSLLKEFGPDICKKSLIITGCLIKYVSPGMFRKSYARFLRECIEIIGFEEELEDVGRMLNKADYLWNKFASYIMKQDISIDERINGEQILGLIQKIYDVEMKCVDKLLEVVNAW